MKSLSYKLVVVFCTVATVAFSQGPSSGPVIFITNKYGTISQLSSGMSFSTNAEVTNSQTFAKDFDQYSMRPILNHGSMFSYGNEYNAKGTRLLFEGWVKGTVVKNSGEEIIGDKYFFNFDKITNNLLVTIDKQEIIEVYKDSIKSFKFSERGKVYAFEKVMSIQRYKFVQVLIKNNDNYSVYKSINTRFVPADYETNGLTESGNAYNEFVDANKYYIVYKDEVRPIDLKFTSIKKALKENSSRVKDFYADHLMDEVDENYLTSIVDYLDQ
jgi:hypothetical protein